MKKVKEFKSYDIQSISHAISNDVNESIERRYQRHVTRKKGERRDNEPMLLTDYADCRLMASTYIIGELQQLLTIAIMELKHKETVNINHIN